MSCLHAHSLYALYNLLLYGDSVELYMSVNELSFALRQEIIETLQPIRAELDPLLAQHAFTIDTRSTIGRHTTVSCSCGWQLDGELTIHGHRSPQDLRECAFARARWHVLATIEPHVSPATQRWVRAIMQLALSGARQAVSP